MQLQVGGLTSSPYLSSSRQSGTFAKRARSANTYFFVYVGLLPGMAYASGFSPDAI
jgi:hypothetical protein